MVLGEITNTFRCRDDNLTQKPPFSSLQRSEARTPRSGTTGTGGGAPILAPKTSEARRTFARWSESDKAMWLEARCEQHQRMEAIAEQLKRWRQQRPAAAGKDESKEGKKAKVEDFWDLSNPNMWLGGCGNTPTDLAKHVAKIVPEKTPTAGTTTFKACANNYQCVVISKSVFNKPGDKASIRVTLTGGLKKYDYYVGILGHKGIGFWDTEG
eukprot:symbB.v1.2.031077.t1/scaffold3569.1/size54013/3